MAMAVIDQLNTPTHMESLINKTNLEKIESFLNDPQYKEALESSANYNTRLCIERRLRLPFIDTQTGVAQNHSSLFMHPRQRIPGLLPGQIYSYPRPRWRKKRRQYLTMNTRSFARAADSILEESEMHSISQVENPALQDTDSKDSQLMLKDEVPKEWYYDEQDIMEMEAFDEPDPDSDLDYEETYKKGRRKKAAGRGRGADSPSTPGRKKGSSGSGRGRKKGGHSFEPTPGDPDKPFACELCGARYKTRPGLTYHYGHSHKEGASDENSRDSNAPLTPTQLSGPVPSQGPSGVPGPFPGLPGQPAPPMQVGGGSPLIGGMSGEAPPTVSPNPGQVYQDSYVSFLNQTPGSQPRPRGRTNAPPMIPPTMQQSPINMAQGPPNLPPNLTVPQSTTSTVPVPQQLTPSSTLPPDDPQMPILQPETAVEPSSSSTTTDQPKEGSGKTGPSPYCDFCLGDSRENKKTGIPEEMVSCSDCGRSGHPSCLQFTPNMMISVKKYRWQCIECKCCSVCGNSDNDDQLLFCDDCDRGYHMYCLTPPLENPPEGSWSCKLCIDLFHK